MGEGGQKIKGKRTVSNRVGIVMGWAYSTACGWGRDSQETSLVHWLAHCRASLFALGLEIRMCGVDQGQLRQNTTLPQGTKITAYFGV